MSARTVADIGLTLPCSRRARLPTVIGGVREILLR
jgi:hypothetical protein